MCGDPCDGDSVDHYIVDPDSEDLGNDHVGDSAGNLEDVDVLVTVVLAAMMLTT